MTIPDDLARRLWALQDLHRDGTPTAGIVPGWLTAYECKVDLAPATGRAARRMGATTLLMINEGDLPAAAVVPLARLESLGIDPGQVQRWPWTLAEEHPERLIRRAADGEPVIITSARPPLADRAGVVAARLLAEQLDLDALPPAGIQPQEQGRVTNTIVGGVSPSAHVIQTGDY